jgi:hypothetical protein
MVIYLFINQWEQAKYACEIKVDYKLVVGTTYKSTYVVYFHWSIDKYHKLWRDGVDLTYFLITNIIWKVKKVCICWHFVHFATLGLYVLANY